MNVEHIMRIDEIRFYGPDKNEISEMCDVDIDTDAVVKYSTEYGTGTFIIDRVRLAFDGLMPVVGDTLVVKRDDLHHDAWTYIIDAKGFKIYDKYVNTGRVFPQQRAIAARVVREQREIGNVKKAVDEYIDKRVAEGK